jgi:hypothetical protein
VLYRISIICSTSYSIEWYIVSLPDMVIKNFSLIYFQLIMTMHYMLIQIISLLNNGWKNNFQLGHGLIFILKTKYLIFSGEIILLNMLFRYKDFATKIYKIVHHISSKIKVVVSPFVHALLKYSGQTQWCMGRHILPVSKNVVFWVKTETKYLSRVL